MAFVCCFNMERRGDQAAWTGRRVEYLLDSEFKLSCQSSCSIVET
jgi:hypothetical protein